MSTKCQLQYCIDPLKLTLHIICVLSRHFKVQRNQQLQIKQTRNLREIKRLVKFFKNYGVVQVSQTTGDESVLFWTSCKCLWTLYGAKTSQCKSEFSSWSNHRIQQLIQKLRNQVSTNILTDYNKSYKSLLLFLIKLSWKFRIRSFGIGCWIRWA